MRKSAISLGSVATAMLFLFLMCQATNAKPALGQSTGNKTFSGVVMDSACAQMGSHSEMEQKHGMKGSDRLTGEAARKCTDLCVQNGSTYVLYDPSSKTTYQLSDQDKAKQYAGDRVRVKGSYDESTKTISVESITPGGKMSRSSGTHGSTR